jgi:hypothetical protein
LTCALLVVSATVFADHTRASAFIGINRNPTPILYGPGPGAACADTACTVDMSLNRRDYNLVVRCFEGTQTDVVIPAGETAAYGVTCSGANYSMYAYAELDAPHDSPVTVTVRVTPR